jgi:hypothetical protein
MPRLAAVLYSGFALLLAVHCYRNPLYDIDLLSYAGNVALYDTTDPVEVHRVVYSNPLPAHLLGTDANDVGSNVLRARAADPYFSATYLPFFSVKPLYLMAMELGHRLGASVIVASQVISAIAFLGIALMVWVYTGSLLAALVILLPEIFVLGESNSPDGLSLFFLLLGFWLLFFAKKDIGILPVLVSIWVRPENVILCGLVIVFLYASGRLRAGQAAVLLLVAAFSQLSISHYGYGWRSLYAHTFRGAIPQEEATFGAHDYLQALTAGLREVSHSSVPVFVLLFIASYRWTPYNMRVVTMLVTLFCVMRFVIFPSFEMRFYAPFFVTTAMSSILAMQGRRGAEAAGPYGPHKLPR